MTNTKECFKCHVTKPLTDFYAHSGMADGRLGKCKECSKKDVKNNYTTNKDYYQEYDRQRAQLPHRVEARKEYASTEEGRESGNRAKKRWAKNNREKAKATWTVNNAIRDGKLERGAECSVCHSTKNVEAHHEDYSKPLEIVWLCKKHHWDADEKRRLAELTLHNVITPEQVPTEL
jgi:hypothetical protein